MKLHPCIVVVAVALGLGLGGCSSSAGNNPAADSSKPASQWLAVARGKVDVEGGMVEIAARTAGVIESVDVTRGEHVKASQVLARLDSHAAKIQVATAKAEVAQAQAKLAELKVSLQQAAWRAPHLAAAAKAGAATGASASAAQAKVAGLRAQQAAAKAALEVARQRLAGAQLTLHETAVRAPVAGIVTQRHVAVGQSVAAASGQSLFTLLPDRPHIVRAQVDSLAADHLHPGMHAQVVRESGAGPVYPATVLWVGTVLQSASLTPSPLTRALANDVHCTLKLAPTKAGTQPLRIGQRVIVRFPRQ